MIYRAELIESLRMAMAALSAHKLRSALTLLGVLVGEFSIIFVMTAMRVLQQNIETELAQLGSHTFAVQKWPGIFFGGSDGFEKFWRRKNITMQQGQLVKDRATLAQRWQALGGFATRWSAMCARRGKRSNPIGRACRNSNVMRVRALMSPKPTGCSFNSANAVCSTC